MKKMKLADSVIAQIAQIVQEAVLTGCDCVDYMRMIELAPDETDPHVLVMTEEYVKLVAKNHNKMLDFIQTWQAGRTTPKS